LKLLVAENSARCTPSAILHADLNIQKRIEKRKKNGPIRRDWTVADRIGEMSAKLNYGYITDMEEFKKTVVFVLLARK
jgi:hypothetical protein